MQVSETMQAGLAEVALDLADAARAVTLRWFRSPGLTADNKSGTGFDPVTLADRESEAAMRAILARRRPDDAILGEEEAARPGTSGLTWVLDPIDGTRAFLSGAPSWGVLIGLDAGQGPVMGIIDQPWTGERFFGGFGQAWTERAGIRRAIRTRAQPGLSGAILYSTFPEVGTPEERAGFESVRDRVRLTRYGLDCYAYALVALGQIDLVVEAGLGAYDLSGPIAVIEAAGGIVTDWKGGPAHHGGRVLAAGDTRVHAEALALLSKVGGIAGTK